MTSDGQENGTAAKRPREDDSEAAAGAPDATKQAMADVKTLLFNFRVRSV